MCRYIDGFRCDNLDFLFRPCECSFPVIILRTFESVLVDGIVDNDLRDFVGCEIMVDLAVKTVEGKIVKDAFSGFEKAADSNYMVSEIGFKNPDGQKLRYSFFIFMRFLLKG